MSTDELSADPLQKNKSNSSFGCFAHVSLQLENIWFSFIFQRSSLCSLLQTCALETSLHVTHYPVFDWVMRRRADPSLLSNIKPLLWGGNHCRATQKKPIMDTFLLPADQLHTHIAIRSKRSQEPQAGINVGVSRFPPASSSFIYASRIRSPANENSRYTTESR